ncbi:MAG: C13 family peptidase [Sphingorhabdus sp.]
MKRNQPVKRRLLLSGLSALLLLGGGTTVSSQNNAQVGQANRGYFAEQNRNAQWFLDQQRNVVKAVAALKPNRRGVVDAYVVVAAIDADPVFGREAAEAAKVLERRFSARGRTITLAAGTGAGKAAAAHGSPANLWAVIAGVAGKMDREEDVLILYTTSHGGKKVGIVYNDGQSGFGMISPSHMRGMLEGLGIKRKLVMISACYSGAFIPALLDDDSVVITAASSVRPSFGCNPGNDWTFFGDALINQSMRQGLSLTATKEIAFRKISEWELGNGLTPSEPQYYAGANASKWLSALERKMPKARTKPVGTPAIAALKKPVPAKKP